MQEVKKIQDAYFGKLSSKRFGPLAQATFDPRTWLKDNLFDIHPTSMFTTTTYLTSLAVIVFFSFLGFLFARKSSSQGAFISNRAFLAARRSQNFFRIGWSFFATSLGAWAIAATPMFSATNGYLGLIGVCIATVIPIFVMSVVGELVQEKLHDPYSLTHFVRQRFGSASQYLALALCLLSSATALLAEYMVLGSVFQTFVGSTPLPITLLISFLTLLYTSYGGLSVSILTDQIQGVFGFFLILFTSIYVSLEFRPTFPTFPEHLGATSQGAWSLLTLPLSFTAYSLFSESMWQRVWAGRNNVEVRRGAIMASILVAISVFSFGVMGFLASWAYQIDPTAPAHNNILFFRILGRDQYNWMGGLLVLLSVILAQGNIDTQQNALTSIFASSTHLSGNSISFSRSLVTLMNIPLVLLGSFYPQEIMQVFLFVNLLSTCAVLPLLSGVVRKLDLMVNGSTFLLGSLSGVFALTSYGMIYKGSILDGVLWAWWENDYDVSAFFTAFLGSLAGIVVSVFSNLGGSVAQKPELAHVSH